MRQLLTHTSGFEGDIFTDTGTGDDCVEKYLGVLHEVPQLFPVGELFSYNNAGFCVLGRLVEVLREQAVRRLPARAAVRAAGTDPRGDRRPTRRSCTARRSGHIELEPGTGYQPAPVWALARSNAPAGAMLAMRPRDLLAFAKMHLEDGRAADGTQVLAPGTAGRMQRAGGRAARPRADGHVVGARLRALRHRRAARSSATTAAPSGSRRSCGWFPRPASPSPCSPTAGTPSRCIAKSSATSSRRSPSTTLPALPEPRRDPERIDASRFVGTYSAEVADLTVSQDDDGRIWLVQTPKGLFEELGEKPERKELVHYRDDSLIPLEPDHGMHMPHAFIGDDGAGHALYLHVGRAIRRAGA